MSSDPAGQPGVEGPDRLSSVEVRALTKSYELGEPISLKRTLGALKRLVTRSAPEGTRFRALDRVSFEVAPGECFGILGENGSGKSTLLSIIGGMTVATEGEVAVRGRVIPFVRTGSAFHLELTGRENVTLFGAVLGLSDDELSEALPQVAEFAELNDEQLDTPVKRYSEGMIARLAFATGLRLPADVYVLDEVLAEADDHFKATCLAEMKSMASKGAAVLFVSHELQLISSVCTRAMWLHEGRVRALGPTAEVTRAYADFEARGRSDAREVTSDQAAARLS